MWIMTIAGIKPYEFLFYFLRVRFYESSKALLTLRSLNSFLMIDEKPVVVRFCLRGLVIDELDCY